MDETANGSRARSRTRVVTTATVQILIAVAAGYWAWLLSGEANEQESPLGAGFWGLIALMNFCGALAFINLVLPLLRASFEPRTHQRSHLKHRLQSISGLWEVTRDLFGLGISFLAPFVPLVLMTQVMFASANELTLLGVGATLFSIVVGGIMVAITGSQLYTMYVMGETVVEISKQPLHPNTPCQLFASYDPGRGKPQKIGVRIVCSASARRMVRPNGERRFGSRRATVLETYSEVLNVTTVEPHAQWPWRFEGAFTLPEDVEPSDPDSSRTIDWFVEVRVALARIPDVCIVFPFKVK